MAYVVEKVSLWQYIRGSLITYGLFFGIFEFCSLYEETGYVSLGGGSLIQVIFGLDLNMTGAAAGGLGRPHNAVWWGGHSYPGEIIH